MAMVVTTGVFMGKLGEVTDEAVGKLIGENFQNQVIGMCSDGWMAGWAFCLGSRRHSILVWRPVND
jgi:hypothetical protein